MANPPKKGPARPLDFRSGYVITKAESAFPALPFHLIRLRWAIYPGGVQREIIEDSVWVGSFPTPELALGKKLLLERSNPSLRFV